MSGVVSMSTDPAPETGSGTPAGAAAPGRVAVIVPAAGKGERLGPGAPKALRELGGLPLLVHAVRTLVAARSVDLVVVAAPPDPQGVAEVQRLLADLPGDTRVVAGGTSRQESVALALAALPADCDVVLVHDAARALTPVEVIGAVVAAVRGGAGAVIPVLPVTDTVKAVDGDLVTATVDRSTLRAVQTPQGFTRDILAKAHAAADPAAPATDDAGLVEALGLPVRTVPGHAEAFKITTPFDLVLAEAVLRRRR
ncbi:2-C-methyl-D-erythritol 4-phosphate cytidylyltransferase [Catenulispora acidiphila DSM 44928]|uniref:2-C-methyl-D-erythritol 4-phosphate cytidylyltransferase n=2 Tax=Catenulispora TaxID=414878 RepID=C7QIR9_CATAD|nr:2-C-methyl-D-erythritol 4-phosphate cytidylyltransferase [Catenulispora acidiphila DSM 44928]